MVAKKEKLNQKLFSDSSKNWKKKDLETLLVKNGFEKYNGTNHDTYIHPETKIKCQLPRHKDILPIYIKIVQDVIRRSIGLESKGSEEHHEKGSCKGNS